MIACEYQKDSAVRYLLQLKNIDVSVIAAQDSTGDSGDSKVVKRKSALHIAAIHDSVEIAKMLIDSGCPLYEQDHEVSQMLIACPLMYMYLSV